MLNKAEINLRILRQNAINIKNSLPSKVKFCAVVKADAYGHGAETVANAIHDLVDFFAVALYEEAYSLRLSGVTKDILVLTPPKSSDIKKSIENEITFCVQDALDISKIEKVASKLKKTVTVQLALNTGMNRLGANADEILSILQALKNCKNDEVYICLNTPESPVKIIPPESDDYTFLVLPMRLNKYDR